MPDFLQEIEQRTRTRVAAAKKAWPVEALRERAANKGPTRGFEAALKRPDRLRIIAELKQSSPSAGMIRRENDLPGRVCAYERGGAAALSILTEADYFHGAPELLQMAREASALPLLRKDFLIDPYQIEESRALGADAVLLIAALLPDGRLTDFISQAKACGLDALVEVHDAADAERVLAGPATLIGVNNRNLRTLEVDLGVAERLAPLVTGAHRSLVIESGVREPKQLHEFRRWGAQAVLIGEALMRPSDPEAAVRAFLQEAEA